MSAAQSIARFMSMQFDPASVRTYEDFARLPLLTKQNYINAYP